ncbi:MAG: hypothetical protein HW418_2485 [Anaerolineales bacterium]|nr:hypothetical protein [Anaerolineales bacterium]
MLQNKTGDPQGPPVFDSGSGNATQSSALSAFAFLLFSPFSVALSDDALSPSLFRLVWPDGERWSVAYQPEPLKTMADDWGMRFTFAARQRLVGELLKFVELDTAA